MPSLRSYLDNAFRWRRGRQGTGYDKMLLATATWPIRFDSYLIRYPEGSEIPPHTDPASDGRHYRLNIVLKSPRSGGEFVCANPIFQTRRIKLFRPDACEHSVTRVQGGSRYVLSVGWVIGGRAA
ncbi:2OG-Fe(II) oxygenase [Ralstonia pseudosolanacearum]|uniref:2OG-Fe(II) oxygenase n=1 Tax=Ralstonia pseudosolanacearum TaxID=1310165 RepID=UPI001C750ED3|nr:2OG-Fe(II) oxygenase [Ralstonia sp. RS642]QWQ14212.1 2OG-Fe(II) oxygenase [Ralstonia solanacearum]UZF27651.1 2OG-Fe(II) oxygenase [Ralstonia sp. RS642]